MSEVHFVSPANLDAPAGFGGLWAPFSGCDSSHSLSVGEAASLNAIVFMCDPIQTEDIELLKLFLCGLGDVDAPPVIWAPHTIAPTGILQGTVIDSSTAQDLLEAGVDGIVRGEPTGFELSLAIQCSLAQVKTLTTGIEGLILSRQQDTECMHRLTGQMHDTFWVYARSRLAPGVPPIEANVSEFGLPLSLVDEWEVGRVLGKGSCGTVFLLASRVGQVGGQEREVLKALEKQKIMELDELKDLQRQIQVMQMLSSEKCPHPNVVELYQIYHTHSHIFFRMEFGGSCDLYQRLKDRDRESPECRPLSTLQTCSLVCQATAAVEHLHVRAQVCHRDIKPENFVVLESGQELLLKITDFDLSIVARPGAICRKACGTLPFSSPEILLEASYDPFASDVWSLAIVLLEVLCGVQIVERLLKLQPGQLQPTVMPRILALFRPEGAVARIFDVRCRPEARAMQMTAIAMLSGMLRLAPADRVSASEIAAAAQLMGDLPCSASPPVRLSLPSMTLPSKGPRPSLWTTSRPRRNPSSDSNGSTCSSWSRASTFSSGRFLPLLSPSS